MPYCYTTRETKDNTIDALTCTLFRSETSSLLEDGKEIETIHPLVTSEPPLPDSSFNNDVEVKEDIVFIPEGAIEKDETLGIIDEPNIC